MFAKDKFHSSQFMISKDGWRKAEALKKTKGKTQALSSPSGRHTESFVISADKSARRLSPFRLHIIFFQIFGWAMYGAWSFFKSDR